MTKILVVDDDRATRHILQKVLTAGGYQTTVAKDGVEALEALRNGGGSICCCSTSGCRA